MKNLLIYFLLSYNSIALLCSQNIGIGTASPDPSAKLEITSDKSGLLVPRMSTTERKSIESPAKGLMVFDTTTNSFWFFNGSKWDQMLFASQVRFGYDLSHAASLVNSYNLNLTENYNQDPTAIALINTTTLQIIRGGLYHFDLLGYTHVGSAASATASFPTVRLSMTVGSKQYHLINNGPQVGANTNYKYSSIPNNFEVYIPSNSLITFNVECTLGGGFFKSDSGFLTGYLISE